MKTIYSCFFSLLFIVLAIPAHSQTTAENSNTPDEKEKEQIYQGTYVTLDVLNPFLKFINTEYVQAEAAVDINLKYAFYPVAEIGYGTVNYSSDNGLSYKSSAPFYRIGLNYNIMSKKKSENHFYVGIRYGLCSMKYDITSNNLKDPIWDSNIEFNRTNMSSFSHWIELGAGVRVQIYKNFMMGWSARLKRTISTKTNGDNEPWYIPGYGYSSTTSIGMTYSITYKFNIINNRRK